MCFNIFRNIQTMLTELQWLSYASIHRYASEILVANEFHNHNFTCSASEATPCRYYTGDEYLKDYFPDAVNNKKLNLGILASFMAFFTTLTILTFKIRGIPNLN
ncbi:hypothetical protein KUTeg_012935 [Tegillarca granosa]|uniref:CDR ABC transporter domain-containing protein n=1 Tax=Tegillarca granosa TaxID=220873 RepID=A0ABQ9ES74_TEGGR|nr:hypothetical protein KUTeg_012931 [Tegillarca granosa]KAJ8308061.1 hypothetical protein KUTeg_012935 [Tegillarca granosa]